MSCSQKGIDAVKKHIIPHIDSEEERDCHFRPVFVSLSCIRSTVQVKIVPRNIPPCGCSLVFTISGETASARLKEPTMRRRPSHVQFTGPENNSSRCIHSSHPLPQNEFSTPQSSPPHAPPMRPSDNFANLRPGQRRGLLAAVSAVAYLQRDDLFWKTSHRPDAQVWPLGVQHSLTPSMLLPVRLSI
ncbi:hypothetical protein OF83DRAFT_171409 [Amylostereum chailletii]|nr:hypothetical protein OF83DRAFT_171409 [Amylostereum chailletii]